MGNFQEVFLIILSLFANLKLMSGFYSCKVFSYELETFKNCKAVKYIMIMIIAIIYIFSSYVIFDQQLKITSRKFSALPEKIHYPSPLLTPPPHHLKIQKLQVPLFWKHWKIFSSPPTPFPPTPCRKGKGGHCEKKHNKEEKETWHKQM